MLPIKDNQAPPHNVRLKPLFKNTGEKEEEKAMRVSEAHSSERTKGQQNKRGGVDVLPDMDSTTAMFQFEMSALNAIA